MIRHYCAEDSNVHVMAQACIQKNYRLGYVLFVYVLVKSYNITCIIQGNKMTPLHWAATNNHPDVMSLLISHGADVNMKDWVS